MVLALDYGGLHLVDLYDDQYEPIVYSLQPHPHHTKKYVLCNNIGVDAYFSSMYCVPSLPPSLPSFSSSKLMRKLAYIAYFSPIYFSALHVAPHLEHTVDIGRSFLLLAPPKSVSWSSVAVHVLHRKVEPRLALQLS